MKIELAPHYRNWMLILMPATLGLGTAVLWLMSLRWPLSIDEEALTLRDRCRVEWAAIRRIRVSRSYLDGRVSRIRIHHATGIANVRVDRLQHGEHVVRIILAMFEHANRVRSAQYQRQENAVISAASDYGGWPTAPKGQHLAAASEASSRQDDTWTRELAMLGQTLAKYPEKIPDSVRFASEEI